VTASETSVTLGPETLAGEVAIVTGGGSGIGRATVLELAAGGNSSDLRAAARAAP
jgi:NAD(P)-dependent dehydrogenase (short-subunit alcohol dehydrogenase family)